MTQPFFYLSLRAERSNLCFQNITYEIASSAFGFIAMTKLFVLFEEIPIVK